MNWQQVCWTELRVRLVCGRDGCRLPGWKGLMLRGTLGHALRGIACWTPPSPCPKDGCRRPHACAMGAIWESSPGVRGDAPPPYIIVPPIGPERARKSFDSGQSLSLRIILVGDARPWAPWFFEAASAPWKLGAERVPWQPERIEIKDDNGEWLTLTEGTQRRRSVWPVVRASSVIGRRRPADTCRVVAQTPIHLQQANQAVERVTPEIFAHRVIDRVADLAAMYCGDIDRQEIQQTKELASVMGISDVKLEPICWHVKQGRRLTGLLGELTLHRVPGPIWPYLVVGQSLHVGKGSSHGQGRYKLVD